MGQWEIASQDSLLFFNVSLQIFGELLILFGTCRLARVAGESGVIFAFVLSPREPQGKLRLRPGLPACHAFPRIGLTS